MVVLVDSDVSSKGMEWSFSNTILVKRGLWISGNLKIWQEELEDMMFGC